MDYTGLPGQSVPLGATVYPDGVNFSVFSMRGDSVDLLLFDQGDYTQPAQVLQFDPVRNRTCFNWHMFVPGVQAGQVYAYRVHGPYNQTAGDRFDGSKVL